MKDNGSKKYADKGWLKMKAQRLLLFFFLMIFLKQEDEKNLYVYNVYTHEQRRR